MTKEKDKNLKNTLKDFENNKNFQKQEDFITKDEQEIKNKSFENTKKSESAAFRKRIKDKQEAKLEQTVEIVFAKEKIARRDTKILELLAEKENLTKRLEKEKEEFLKYRAGSFLNQIIPSLDMMEKALSTKNVSPEVQNWLKGFEMIFNNFITSMEKEGVKIITVKPGDYYNPKYHHAIDEQYSDDYKPGQIIKAHNQAYLLHDRLLRPASVIVARSKNLYDENIEDQNEEKIENINNKDEEKNG